MRSPIDRVAVEVPAVLGERVDDSEPLYRIARLEPLWLEIGAPLDRLQGVRPGGAVEIPCDAGEARIDLIGRNVDPANQTVLVRAEVKGVGTCLRPGQFVEVRLQRRTLVRVARLLLHLVGDDSDGVCYLPPREDIAAIIGTAAETASRVVAEFRRSGIIEEIAPRQARVDVEMLKGPQRGSGCIGSSICTIFPRFLHTSSLCL